MVQKGFARRDNEQMTMLRQFIAEQGGSLFWQAAFDTLHIQQVREDETRWGWPAQPEMYQNVDSPEVRQFCEGHRDDADFYLWLQWLAYSQLVACWEISQGYEMPIGLYCDLAASVAEGGAGTWCDCELYYLKASVSAPPDILGSSGQNWGLPPMNPYITTARAYEPFIELLCANMQNCGTSRVDHVMPILRLWWIPYDETIDQDTYVHYPVNDPFSIPAFESRRRRYMVIGEGLSTVPVGIVDKPCSNGVHSYGVLYFENDCKKAFRALETYPEQSMAVVVTYDLPTLRDYWESEGLTLDKMLGLYPDGVVLYGLYQDREPTKQGLLDASYKYGCLPKHAGHRASLISMTPTLNRGPQRYIAGSNNALLELQPEDWLDMTDSVDIPGISYQHKDWRRKPSATPELMLADDNVSKLLRDLDRRRRAAAKKRQSAADVGCDA